jgi:hypothetical protein
MGEEVRAIERARCIHVAVCKHDDGMCPRECGHYETHDAHGKLVEALREIASSSGCCGTNYSACGEADHLKDAAMDALKAAGEEL